MAESEATHLHAEQTAKAIEEILVDLEKFDGMLQNITAATNRPETDVLHMINISKGINSDANSIRFRIDELLKAYEMHAPKNP